MGLDLTLMPIDALERSTSFGKSYCWGFSHTVLPLHRIDFDDYLDLHARSAELPDGHTVSGHIAARIVGGKHDGEKTYGTFTTDPYGTRVKWAPAGELKPLLERSHPTSPATAFVKALADDNLVILWWH